MLFLQPHSRQFLEHLTKLLKRHLLVALRVLLEDFDEESAVDAGMQFCDLKILGEHHEFVDGHDGGLVHDLLESRVLACGVTGLAVVIEDDPKVVLIFSGEVLEVELVGVACEVVVGVFFGLWLVGVELGFYLFEALAGVGLFL